MGDETTVGEPGTATSMDRREMLRRSALVGGAGALMWAAPSVTRFASPAFGDTGGTPGGKGLSYIALQYKCNQGTTRYIKFDLNAGTTGQQTIGGTVKCTTGDRFQTPGCTSQFPQPTRPGGNNYSGDCAKFTVTYNQVDDGGKPIKVTITANTPCVIDGSGFGKCGNPDNPNSGGECVAGTKNAPTDATVITFSNCGTK